MVIYFNRAISLQDGSGRPHPAQPGCRGLTVEQAAELIRAVDATLPAYVRVVWDVYADMPQTISHQVAVKTRRLRQLGRACGRIVRNVQPVRGFESAKYEALLVR